jgi:hypothetical protein
VRFELTEELPPRQFSRLIKPINYNRLQHNTAKHFKGFRSNPICLLSPCFAVSREQMSRQCPMSSVLITTVRSPLVSLNFKECSHIAFLYLMVQVFHGLVGVMNRKERVILHRERLYKEVWESPISQLAPKYGVSDVGLAKICKRMDIPIPPRGYWAKVAYGYKVKKPALPALQSRDVEQITINKSGNDLLHVAKNRFLKSKVRHSDRQRIHRLRAEIRGWEESQKVRAYVAAMRSGKSKPNKAEKEWLTWAEQYADHLDPAVDFRIDALDEV